MSKVRHGIKHIKLEHGILNQLRGKSIICLDSRNRKASPSKDKHGDTEGQKQIVRLLSTWTLARISSYYLVLNFPPLCCRDLQKKKSLNHREKRRKEALDELTGSRSGAPRASVDKQKVVTRASVDSSIRAAKKAGRMGKIGSPADGSEVPRKSKGKLGRKGGAKGKRR